MSEHEHGHGGHEHGKPAAPTVDAVGDNETASITVRITNPEPGPHEAPAVRNDVYISAPGVPEYRAAKDVPPNTQWTFRTPASGLVYTFRAVAFSEAGEEASSDPSAD